MGGRSHAGLITLLVEPGSLLPGSTVPLSDEETHHLRVRRGEALASIRVTDGAGAVAIGSLVGEGKGFAARLDQVEQVPPPPPLILAVGAGDRDRFGFLVEKAAELGATRIIPLDVERSQAVAGRVRESSVERLQRRAREGVKQCGSAWAPVVEEPVELGTFVSRSGSGLRLVADHGGRPAPEKIGDAEEVAIAVGPEGGFTEDEFALLLGAGFVPLGLGPHVLRFETAGLAALAAVWQARQRGFHG